MRYTASLLLPAKFLEGFVEEVEEPVVPAEHARFDLQHCQVHDRHEVTLSG